MPRSKTTPQNPSEPNDDFYPFEDSLDDLERPQQNHFLNREYNERVIIAEDEALKREELPHMFRANVIVNAWMNDLDTGNGNKLPPISETPVTTNSETPTTTNSETPTTTNPEAPTTTLPKTTVARSEPSTNFKIISTPSGNTVVRTR